MKRYLIFRYDTHYPAGGKYDFVKDVDDLSEALNHTGVGGGGYDNMDILDTTHGVWHQYVSNQSGWEIYEDDK